MENLNDHLEPEKTALVVIDLQNGTMNRPLFPHSSAQVIQNVKNLIDLFTEKGAFVALVRVSHTDGKDRVTPKTDFKRESVQLPEGWDRFVPELENIKNVYKMIKRQWGAFYGTDLDLQLRRRGIDTIVLCGVSTAYGVDTTAREAYQLGYHQVFVEDAMAAASEEEHAFVMKHIFPKIGRIRIANQIADAWGES